VHDEREIEAVLEVLRSGLLDLGPRVAEFERRGAELLAKSHSVMVNSARPRCGWPSTCWAARRVTR
jgi:dTDP-4-amino-4,6-dideoxygalactose transaminase